MMTRSLKRTMDEIVSYENLALDLLALNHPHYEEIKKLLTDQINDEIRDYAYTITD